MLRNTAIPSSTIGSEESIARTTAAQNEPQGSVSWNQRVREAGVSKAFLNKIVMDYLLIEGFRDAAEAFAEESGTEGSLYQDLGSRMCNSSHACVEWNML